MQLGSSRSRASGGSSAGPLLVLGVLAVLAVVLAYFGIRALSEDSAPIAEQARRLLEPAASPTAEAPSAPSAQPAPGVATAPPPPEHVRPSEPLAAFEHTAGECLPTLLGLSGSVRVLALDASPDNVDFVQESATAPQRFVRLTCRDTDSGPELAEVGRVQVPGMVGKADALPEQLIDQGELTAQWLLTRVSAAAQAGTRGELRRVEVSFVAGRVLSRVTLDDRGRLQRILIDAEGRKVDSSTPFPQVERLIEMTDAAAERGYRDLGQTLWSVGVAETVERMSKVYFPPTQPLRALEVGRLSVALVVPAGDAEQMVTIDSYGDRSEPQPTEPRAGYCRQPFPLSQARRALDAAIRDRGETLESFERREFTYAAFGCIDNPRQPNWQFEGG